VIGAGVLEAASGMKFWGLDGRLGDSILFEVVLAVGFDWSGWWVVSLEDMSVCRIFGCRMVSQMDVWVVIYADTITDGW